MGITEVQRKFFGTLYNTYSFFSLYANIDNFKYAEQDVPLNERPEIDRWIISLLNSLITKVHADYADYEATNAIRKIQHFVDAHLSNWYVRLCRRRFWKGEYTQDKIAAYQTLYQCMNTISKLMAPVAPFFADWLYQNLNTATNKEDYISVHLADFPKADETAVDTALEERMDYGQRISSLVLSLRKKEKIRVRQPLKRVLLPVLNAEFQEQVEGVRDLIQAEVNVKGFEYITDTAGIVNKKIKPNFKTLGRILGKNMKAAVQVINNLGQEDIAAIEANNTYQLDIEGEQYNLSLEDFEIVSEDIPGWQVASDGPLTVALDISLDEDLLDEGLARELVNRIQNIRKASDFNVTDRINISLTDHTDMQRVIEKFGDYVKAEVLADSITFGNDAGEEVELSEEIKLMLLVKKT